MSLDDQLNPLAESGVTMRSDSEQYSPGDELSTSPESTSSSPVILYTPPTIWSLLRGTAINILLPFINGMMLGFGELFAHEAAFRLGWGGTKVCFSDDGKGTHIQSSIARKHGQMNWSVLIGCHHRSSPSRGEEHTQSALASRRAKSAMCRASRCLMFRVWSNTTDTTMARVL